MLTTLAVLAVITGQSLPECRLVERAVIPPPANDEFIIGRTAAIAVDANGRLYIADQAGPDGGTIQVIEPNGRRRSLGRVGSGPGEYRALDGGMVVLNDGRVLVRDAGNGRFVVFATDGRPATHWDIRPTYGFTPLLPGDSGVVSLVAFRPGENGTGMNGGQVLVRISADGRVRDTLAIPQPVDEPVAMMQSPGGMTRLPIPFAARPLWTWRPSIGLVIARSDSAWIEMHNAGRLSRTDLGPLERARFSAGEREAVEAQLSRSTNGGRYISGARIPSRKPYIRALWAAPDDRTWVLHHMPGIPRQEPDSRGQNVTRWTEPLHFTIVDATGVARLRVRGPAVRYDPRISPAIRGDTLWLAVTGEDAVPRVLRLEINCARE